MSKKIFTDKEIKQLSNNPNVRSVSSKAITYTDAFKQLFISENNKGKPPREIFEVCGFDVTVIGLQRVESSAKRWRASYQENGILGLQDTRSHASGRPLKRELTLEEKYAKLEAQNALLRGENELLKKNSFHGKEAKQRIVLSSSQKFVLIHTIIEKYQLSRLVNYLCKVSGVSRSGYYRYWSSEAKQKRIQKKQQDEQLREVILKAFHFKRRKKGARSIKMTLEGQFKVIYNLKRIRRIMKKYSIVCPFRRANPYKRMMKATQEHRVVPNLLNREFKQNIPGKVLLTDITYLFYGSGKKAYLSTIKDSSTNEILAYHVSDRITMDLATDTLLKLKKNQRFKRADGAFIHSDQGSHYTHPYFQKMVKKMKLKQSMSRRGNCWDNAPQESFFGHFKDQASIKPCLTLIELKQEIKDYMTYYNHYRYQWDLKKMTPVQYRDHLLQSA
ncbi:IS3 family transposase [Paenibacillus sp. G2S3]|uniref:IS3 family transposase n=1 Tax=Paenibacillus sp. G2S3 TaxID=3047872 RepID=UPI0024C1E9F2|nr:IS3 family transposase [Paenibacillus sp. G2S3]WHY17583.1 IS3 family transposase [Paenibacillus sp. G2S3]WHY17673.1 IS3 family transposase [Paenibacillus sp. G2S3]